jgi:4-amino-4-deoxy-L-arabinose transferase-like glycosyltransferase
MAAVLVTFGALAVVSSLLVPLGEGIDEAAHLQFVDYVRVQQHLPVQELETSSPIIMGHHPPLYYVLGAVLTGWADTDDLWITIPANPRFVWTENANPDGWNVHLHSMREAWPYKGAALAIHVLRLFSAVCGTLSVYAQYRVVRLLLPNRPWLVLAAVALIAFNPGYVQSSSTVHHDPLQTLFFALGLWWMLNYVQHGGRWVQWELAGLLASSALLTKLSGLALLGAMGCVLLLRSVVDRDWRSLVLGEGVISGMAAVLTGWWYLRNLRLYGDPWGWAPFQVTFSDVLRQGPYNWFFFQHEFIAQLGRNFWGGFGFMHILAPPIFRQILWGISAAGGLGLVIGAARRHRAVAGRQLARLHVAALVMVGCVLAIFVRGSFDIKGWGHGRYLFGVLAPLMAWVVLGLDELTLSRARHAWGLMIPAGMLSYAAWATCIWMPDHYALPTPADPSLLDRAVPVHALFSSGVELVGYTWMPSPTPPGSDAELCTLWKSNELNSEDLRIRVTLRDRLGSPLQRSIDFWPVDNGFPPQAWQHDEVYVDCRSLYVPPNAYAGQSLVLLEKVDPESKEPYDESVSLPVSLGKRVEGESGVDKVTIARIGECISLVGFAASQQVQSGDTVKLVLYWQADCDVQENYTVFVQVLNANGFLVAQKDNEPGQGQYPTSIWEAGQIISDAYLVPLPNSLPAGDYQIIVGMYTLPSIERLPVRVNDQIVGDYIELSLLHLAAE